MEMEIEIFNLEELLCRWVWRNVLVRIKLSCSFIIKLTKPSANSSHYNWTQTSIITSKLQIKLGKYANQSTKITNKLCCPLRMHPSIRFKIKLFWNWLRICHLCIRLWKIMWIVMQWGRGRRITANFVMRIWRKIKLRGWRWRYRRTTGSNFIWF